MFIRRHGNRGTGVDVAIGQIVSAQHLDEGYLVTDTQGERHKFSDTEWKIALELAVVSMVPAQPGTFFLSSLSEDDGSSTIIRQTVVGWAMHADGELRPVLMDPEALSGETNWAIEMPGGRVESNSLATWADAQAWLDGRPD